MTPDHPHETTDLHLQRTLHALGHAEPPLGMHSRLLASLERHEAAPVLATPQNLLRRWHLATTALVSALLLAIFAATHLGHVTKPTARPDLSQRVLTPRLTVPVPDVETPVKRPRPSVAMAARGTAAHLADRVDLQGAAEYRSAVAQKIGTRGSDTRAAELPAQGTLAAVAQAALDDTQAPSQPAPPMPPTQQEILVSRLLRGDRGTEIAGLDLARDPALAAAERAQLHAFFEPRPAPKHDEEPGTPAANVSAPSPQTEPSSRQDLP